MSFLVHCPIQKLLAFPKHHQTSNGINIYKNLFYSFMHKFIKYEKISANTLTRRISTFRMPSLVAVAAKELSINSAKANAEVKKKSKLQSLIKITICTWINVVKLTQRILSLTCIIFINTTLYKCVIVRDVFNSFISWCS